LTHAKLLIIFLQVESKLLCALVIRFPYLLKQMRPTRKISTPNMTAIVVIITRVSKNTATAFANVRVIVILLKKFNTYL